MRVRSLSPIVLWSLSPARRGRTPCAPWPHAWPHARARAHPPRAPLVACGGAVSSSYSSRRGSEATCSPRTTPPDNCRCRSL
eukprot:294322-Prymnesium_polylepis.2